MPVLYSISVFSEISAFISSYCCFPTRSLFPCFSISPCSESLFTARFMLFRHIPVLSARLFCPSFTQSTPFFLILLIVIDKQQAQAIRPVHQKKDTLFIFSTTNASISQSGAVRKYVSNCSLLSWLTSFKKGHFLYKYRSPIFISLPVYYFLFQLLQD